MTLTRDDQKIQYHETFTIYLYLPEITFGSSNYFYRVPQLTCTWMSLPGATGLGKLTSVEGKISGDLDSDFDLTHLEDKIRAQRIKD